MSELNHPAALLATPPPFVLCQLMQGYVPCISLLQREILVLFTAQWRMPRNPTFHTDKSFTNWALNTAIIRLTWWTCPSCQTFTRIKQDRTIRKGAVDSIWVEDICFCKGCLQWFIWTEWQKRFALYSGNEIFTSQLRTSDWNLRWLHFPINIGSHTMRTELVGTFHCDHHWIRLVLTADRTVFRWFITLGRRRDNTDCYLS